MIHELASTIDHTLLKPEATSDQVRRLCDEALENGFAAVCVNPVFLGPASKRLAGSRVQVCGVIGFPLGANHTAVKVFEARRATDDGATELDMVINVGALKGGEADAVRHDIEAVIRAVREAGALCKVILETALLTDDEKTLACQIAVKAGADFVKTSTGFGPGGATVDDVRLMCRAVAGSGVRVKASGGIRDLATARSMIEAGAARLGTSSGLAILREARV